MIGGNIDRLDDHSRVAAGVAEGGNDVGGIGINGERRAVDFDGVAGGFGFGQSVAEVEAGIDVFRAEVDRFAERADRFLGAA